MSPLIESLESRLCLSSPSAIHALIPLPTHPAIHAAPKAAAATFNLRDLLGYSRRGAAWYYNTSYKATDSDGTETGSGPGKIAVNSKTTTIDNRISNLVTFSGADSTLISTWSADRTGSNINSIAIASDFGKINLTLHDTRIAPKSLTIGQSYSDKGTFDGKFTVPVDGTTVTGSATGASSITTRLIGSEQVTVPAGTFTAIKGTYAIQTTGSVRLRYQGRTITASFTVTVKQTFYAVPGTGIVKGATNISLKVSVPGQGSESGSVAITTAMTSFK